MEQFKTVQEAVKSIKDSVTQVSASKKDEVTLMQTMLNDRNFEVDVYAKSGKTGTYAPGKDFREALSSMVSGVANIDQKEAESLVEGYDVTRKQAESMVNVSKEFVNTYMTTGRKLNLGGRKTSNVSLTAKHCDAQITRYPKTITKDGEKVTISAERWGEAYDGIKASSPRPSWINSKPVVE